MWGESFFRGFFPSFLPKLKKFLLINFLDERIGDLGFIVSLLILRLVVLIRFSLSFSEQGKPGRSSSLLSGGVEFFLPRPINFQPKPRPPRISHCYFKDPPKFPPTPPFMPEKLPQAPNSAARDAPKKEPQFHCPDCPTPSSHSARA